MDKTAKEIIVREGFIISGLVILYVTCLLAAFLLPYATVLQIIYLAIIAVIVFGYLLYLIIKFTVWAIKILNEK